MASAKKKKEKKKDFAKAKLKVGKTKAKADNFTDTSFRARALVLSKQSIAADHRSADDDADSSTAAAARFAHHVSLLRHRSDTQRAESLAYLTNAIASFTARGAELSTVIEPTATLLPKLQPLLLDGSPAVRTQLLKLLRALPSAEIPAHAAQLLLYTRAGMTHLAADIRLFSMDVLDWLVGCAPDEAVTSPGAWTKTLACFVGLLGWQAAQTRASGSSRPGGWSAATTVKSSHRPGSEARAVARYTHALAAFLRAGLVAVQREAQARPAGMPLLWVPQFGLPQRSSAFAHLNLFGPQRDEENEIFEDREDRQRVFEDTFESAIQAGIGVLKSEGGELGRAGAALRRAVDEGMVDYERDESL